MKFESDILYMWNKKIKYTLVNPETNTDRRKQVLKGWD